MKLKLKDITSKARSKKKSSNTISAVKGSGNSKESTSTEANLLFAILEKLEEIRCVIVDIKDRVA